MCDEICSVCCVPGCCDGCSSSGREWTTKEKVGSIFAAAMCIAGCYFIGSGAVTVHALRVGGEGACAPVVKTAMLKTYLPGAFLECGGLATVIGTFCCSKDAVREAVDARYNRVADDTSSMSSGYGGIN